MARHETSATSDWRDGVRRISQAHRLDHDTVLVVEELANELERQGNDREHADAADRALVHMVRELQGRVRALEERANGSQ